MGLTNGDLPVAARTAARIAARTAARIAARIAARTAARIAARTAARVAVGMPGRLAGRYFAGAGIAGMAGMAGIAGGAAPFICSSRIARYFAGSFLNAAGQAWQQK